MLTSSQMTIGLIAAALLLTVATCLISFIRTPPLIKRRFDLAMRRSGLYNAQKEYPSLVSVKHDRNKPHGLILEVRNLGISIPDFDAHIERLKATLNGVIYGMEYARRVDHTRIWFLPQKYVRPSLFDPADDAIGSIGISRLINLLVVGSTGTGKTVAIKVLMSKISKFQNNAKIWLLDFKQFDFKNFSFLPHYYGYTNCLNGLNDYYEAFKRQQQLGVAGELNYLVIDEWGSFIMSLEKKDAEQAKAKLAELLMLGRAYGFYPIVGIQRPDMTYFTGGSRDNFHCCLAMGNLSKEGRKMVFPDNVSDRLVECHKREGHLFIEGVGIEKIRVVDITDIDKLDAIIRDGMSR